MNEVEIRIVQNLEASDVLAYKYKDAARVIGLSYGSLRNEMIRGHLHPLKDWKLVSRDELIRWVKEQERKPAPRERAKRVDAPKNGSVSLSE